MKRVFALLASFIALIACDRFFDISDQVGESTVWMTFIPSNDYDTTFFCLQATTPLAGSTSPVLTRDEKVEVLVNGRSLALDKSARSVPDKMQFYSTGHTFAPGDLVEVVATVPGTGSVSSSCTVPEPFPACNWNVRLTRRSEDENIVFLDIDYADSGEAGYYGAAVIEYSETDSQFGIADPETGELYWGDPVHSTSEQALYPCSMSDSDALSAAGETPVSVSPGYYNTMSGGRNENVQIWCDVPGQAPAGGRRQVTLAARVSQPGVTEYHYVEPDYEYHHRAVRSCKYRIVFYRFSESCYKYLKAQYNSSYSDFSELGLAPASFVYTNVKGGAGVCGSYTVLSTDWFELSP